MTPLHSQNPHRKGLQRSAGRLSRNARSKTTCEHGSSVPLSNAAALCLPTALDNLSDQRPIVDIDVDLGN
jgi:hypothetical protein